MPCWSAGGLEVIARARSVRTPPLVDIYIPSLRFFGLVLFFSFFADSSVPGPQRTAEIEGLPWSTSYVSGLLCPTPVLQIIPCGLLIKLDAWPASPRVVATGCTACVQAVTCAVPCRREMSRSRYSLVRAIALAVG